MTLWLLFAPAYTKDQGCYSTDSHLWTKSRMNVKDWMWNWKWINNNTMAHLFWNRVHNDLSRSLILTPIESANRISYWSSIVTLVLSCGISVILELLYAESHFFRTHSYSGQNFGGVPLGVYPWCLGLREQTSHANYSWHYFRRISDYVITVPQRHGQTDDLP